ncbi:YHS domain-containing protein [Sanguibacter gelidistatuariae]|uniref:YHS domain-containing protein n=1 Tax=Sanguibacter gelidistatuariae TaxID=1814289 RepID=A0A1G6VK32_9MICO|nr:YHS domain-containing protein [Sanguibacter gelidistatuariae]SDD53275.1 YHS domain-containing protein [Sanguibacter gelidistatuariae]
MTNEPQATSSCCSTSAPAPAAAAGGRKNLLDAGASDDMTTCPVMVGRPVSKKAAEASGLYRDYEGTRYYFCCPGCGPAFDSDPARHAATMA